MLPFLLHLQRLVPHDSLYRRYDRQLKDVLQLLQRELQAVGICIQGGELEVVARDLGGLLFREAEMFFRRLPRRLLELPSA